MTGPHRNTARSAGNHAKRFFVALLLAAAVGVPSVRPAASQQNSGGTAAAAGVEAAPRGQRDAKDIAYGDWRKLCFKPGGAKTLCRTSITGTFATGQTAVRLDIIEREDGAARLQVFAPTGMYLPPGIKLTVDQGTPRQVPYNWCLANACIAADAAEPKLLEDLNQGQAARLEFVDSNLLSLTTSVPLGRFAAVRKGAPAQTFEQDIDE
jgi:invasion protein IalB